MRSFGYSDGIIVKEDELDFYCKHIASDFLSKNVVGELCTYYLPFGDIIIKTIRKINSVGITEFEFSYYVNENLRYVTVTPKTSKISGLQELMRYRIRWMASFVTFS